MRPLSRRRVAEVALTLGLGATALLSWLTPLHPHDDLELVREVNPDAALAIVVVSAFGAFLATLAEVCAVPRDARTPFDIATRVLRISFSVLLAWHVVQAWPHYSG